MKVVQICPYPFPSLGGPARSYQHFNRILHSKVIGLVRASHAAKEKPVVPLSLTVRVLDPLKLGYYYFAPAGRLREAEKLIAAADCVFVHGFFLYPEIWTMRTCRRHGVPYVIIPHGIFDPWAMRKNTFIKQLWIRVYGRQVLRHAARVLYATETEQTKAAWLPVRVPGSVIKWAVELVNSASARSRREEVRRSLGLVETDRVLIFFGRLHSMKRPLETVRLLAGFGFEHLKLMVVGPDGDVTQTQLQAEADAAGWTGLRVIGPVWDDKKYDYICAADGYISLSHRENFNYTLGETMAAGLAPIISPGNDLGLEFARDDFAWQLKGDSADELRAVVREFLDLPDAVLRARGEAASRWAHTHLNMQRFDAEVHHLLMTLAQQRAAKNGPP
jgi:glycosyltransferase involved in cell wall biosynthesis